MTLTGYLSRARRITLGLPAALAAIGVAACSSTTPPITTSSPPSIVIPAQTGSAPKNIVMPDLVGMYWKEAQPKLYSLGWAGVIDKGPAIPGDPRHWNRIVTQSPAPGDPLTSDGRITLQFGV